LDEVAEALTREEGKTVAESKGEAARGVSLLRYYAGEALQPTGEVYPSASPSTFLYAERVPLGVVALITPWNFPVAIPTWKVAPALVYGNTVVLKPAELTPLTAWHLADVLEKAGLPPGVLNLVVGRGSRVGEVLVSHPQVKAISFTGSNAVGAGIAARAAERGIKYQLEMGGKNPVVVLRDADLDKAVELTIAGAMLSTGQKCTATSRVIVERDVLANQVRFGLSASIVTRDLGLALRFVRAVEAGIVHVNSQTAGAEPQVPFGGFKGSSSGTREQGKAAREFFTQIKTVYLDPP